MTFFNIVAAIFVFGLIIFIHELGHFTVAKLSGISVLQFSIGFGPAIIKKQWGETLYAIRLLPFGGAVMMKGEISDEGEIDTSPGTFQGAPVWNRIGVAFAGSFMNFVMGLVILFTLSLSLTQLPSPEITEFAQGFPYESAEMFQVGDKIVRVNDFKVYIYGDLMNALEMGYGKPYDVTINRGGEKIVLQDITIEKKVYQGSENPRFGLSFAMKPAGLLERGKYAIDSSASFLQSVLISLKYLVTGQVGANQLIGAVGITTEIGNRVGASMTELWYFVAFLSINLSVVNLLPIPGLDGGKLVFLGWEAISKKPIKPKYEAYLQGAGLLMMLALFVFVTFNDIARLIGG